MFYDICAYILAQPTFDIRPTLYGAFFRACSMDQVSLFPVKCCFMTFSFFSSSPLSALVIIISFVSCFVLYIFS